MIAGSFADAMEPIEINNRLSKFLDETDMETKDLALQLQAGDNSTDLVIPWRTMTASIWCPAPTERKTSRT